jgi:hypothetical protein
MSMYSPKIKKELIPRIFRAARAEGIPMTRLVNRILDKALRGGGQDEEKEALSGGKESAISQEAGGDIK